MNSWTEPYYGITYYPKDDGVARPYVSVTQIGNTFELTKWYLGCQFHPIKESFDDLNKAKRAGERWIKTQNKI